MKYWIEGKLFMYNSCDHTEPTESSESIKYLSFLGGRPCTALKISILILLRCSSIDSFIQCFHNDFWGHYLGHYLSFSDKCVPLQHHLLTSGSLVSCHLSHMSGSFFLVSLFILTTLFWSSYHSFSILVHHYYYYSFFLIFYLN